jgi:tungstate transport system substrate-binding protein
VNPARHQRVKYDAARSFIEFLVSRPIQEAIATFKRAEYGESLFFPDAIPQ